MGFWDEFNRLFSEAARGLFERMQRRVERLHELAVEAHRDQGACDGRGACKFCDAIADVMKEEAGG